ncbi:MAG TPA: STAS domain-containing protein [Thermomonospora sp.]|nr:STAS domain-containing protein [Thermomonospora sp.]
MTLNPGPAPDDVGGDPYETPLRVTVGLRGRWVTIEVGGDIDMTTGPLLEERIGTALESSPWVVLEAAEVTFCDSSGLNVLIRAWRKAVEAGGRLVLLRPSGHLRRVLEITGLDERLDITDMAPE